MTLTSIIGLVAAALTTGAYVPQAYKTIKTRSTSDLSISTYLMLLCGTICWLVYGINMRDLPLILAKAITATLSGILFYLKLTSKSNAKN